MNAPVFNPVLRNIQEHLEAARWKSGMCVTTSFGERVFLKDLIVDGKKIGVTDCCHADRPCEAHKGNRP